MVRTAILLLILSITYQCSVAEYWHCGADNMPFTTDFLRLVAQICPWDVRVNLNNACHRHDSCYHQAKPANGGSERARFECDQKLCSNIIKLSPILWNACGQALLAHCGGAITLGWIAQIDWDKIFKY